jgi:hypothetical protein
LAKLATALATQITLGSLAPSVFDRLVGLTV